MPLVIPRALTGAPLDADAWYNLVAATLEAHDARFAEIAAREAVIVARNTTLSLPVTTDTVITWTATGFANPAMWSSGTDVILPRPGIYAVFAAANVVIPTSATAQAQVKIRHNGALLAESHYPEVSGNDGGTAVALVRGPAGDTLSLALWHNSAGAGTLNTARMGVVLVSEA